METCLTTFLTGDFIKGATCVWTSLPGGLGEWFYPLMLLGLQIAIYGKTQNMTTVLGVGIIVSSLMAGGGLFTGTAAGVMQLPILVLVLNVGALFAKVVLKL